MLIELLWEPDSTESEAMTDSDGWTESELVK